MPGCGQGRWRRCTIGRRTSLCRPSVLRESWRTTCDFIDPRRFSGPRDPFKLEAHHRSLRTADRVANERHKGTGKYASEELKLYVNGDSRLLYIQCVLFGPPVMGSMLRTIPPVAPFERGLPGSAAVGQPVQGPAKRPKVADVTFQGLGWLTEALGDVAQAGLGPSAAYAATDVHNFAQAVGTVMKQVRGAHRDVADDPDDPTAQIVVKHLLARLTKLTTTDSHSLVVVYAALPRNGACTFARTNMHSRPLREMTRAAGRPIISPGDV